ncbi:hypothetical protein DL96DRAFT_1642440 [Flagelloscypha sp. PMI_526]|nr:hypothetical protein DL96DRAFT_1642440 [Flagelloscypha sp. PMI_526]
MLLPLEVLENIVDISDLQTACSWSLTCKALVPRSQANVHSNLTLTDKDWIPYSHVLDQSPHLASSIHHLSILDIQLAHYYTPESIECFEKVLSKLHHLHTLSLVHWKWSACAWSDVPQSLQHALIRCFNLETLQAVDVQLFEDALDFLKLCPKVRHLDLYHPRELLYRPSKSVPRVSLESLRLSGSLRHVPIHVNSILGTNGDPFLDLTRLQTLVIEFHTSWFSHIIPLASSSLTSLYLRIHSDGLGAFIVCNVSSV